MKFIEKARIVAIISLAASITWVIFAKSQTTSRPPAAVNGSFEITKAGLPGNWIFYKPRKSSQSDYEIELDPHDPVDGNQSLKFNVRKCSGKPGRFSPGFTQEFKAAPGETWTVSFWAKNKGCKFSARAGAVRAFDGSCTPFVTSNETFETWRQFSTNITIPPGMTSIRWELTLLEPGTFWIDDLRIEKTTNRPGGKP